LAVGAWLLWSQHYQVATFRPTDGRILEWRLKWVSDDYTLVAKYDYQVGGRTYTGDRPFSIPGSDVVAAHEQLRPGDVAPVYYNPADPSKAFVLRGDVLMPSVLVFLGTLMFVSMVGIFGVGMSSLPPARKRAIVLLLAFFWHLAGAFVIASYFTVGSRVSGAGGFLALAAGYELVGLLPVDYGLRGNGFFAGFGPPTSDG
ncbi:MAG: DUF3592 domain-containing protein, partial [Planctomycetota bacterium]